MVDVEVDLNLLRDRLAPIGATNLRRLAGGASSLTYAADTPEGPVVVKVAPAGLEPVRNRDVLRQADLLRRLGPTAVPVPHVRWDDAGDPPDVPPLFVMTFVDGTSLEPLFDHDGTDEPDVVADRMVDAARVLGALHALDPGALGLDHEPPVGLTGEVERWARALRTVDQAVVPGWEDVADRLRATMPPPLPPAVVHGDFRLGNLLATGPAVTAVIDWEIWSVSDPRVDLGWFLVNADPATYGRATRYATTVPSPDDLLAAYGRDVPDLDWFRALACFKSTATWSLIRKHAGPMAADVSLPNLLAQAADRLSR